MGLGHPPSGPARQGALPQVSAPLPPLCHVTVVAPRKRADLALPADIPLPNVLPGLLRAVGEVDGDAAAGPGWVLQRLGGQPFDLGQSLGAVGVLDGEVLYLRPRDAILPPALFDDVADVVATGVKDGGGEWLSSHTRRFGLGAACTLLAAGALALMLSRAPWPLTVIVAGVFALLLVATGTIMSRAMGQAGSGAPMGYAALPYAFLTGLLFPVGDAGFGAAGVPSLLAAFACTALVATFGGTLIADGSPGFLGVAIASVAGVVMTAVLMFSALPAAGVAAMTVTVLLAFTPLIPTLAFRLAGVPLPSMPTTADELRSDNQQLDAVGVRERTGRARRYVTGMVAGITLTAVIAQIFLVVDGGMLARIMSVVISLTLLMRARVFSGFGARLWLNIAGLAGLTVLAVSMSLGTGGVTGALVATGLLWLALMAAGIGVWLQTSKPSPFWGRAGDIVDLILIGGLFPLALGVLEVYAWVRGLSG